MVFLMVMIGGITRLTESGLSITEWKPVTGIVPPLSEAEWQAEFEKYKQIPQYTLRFTGDLAEFKTIFFWEWLHRAWGRLIGIVFLVPLVWLAASGRVDRSLVPRLAGIFLLGAIQGGVGWWMVKSGLADRTEVSQYRLTVHLGLAVVIYGAMLWVALDLLRPPRVPAPAGLRRAASVLLGLVFVTLLSGGLVAGLRAGLTYNTFPLMDGRLVPEGYAGLQPLWLNWFETIPAVQFNHRLLAVTTFGTIVAVWAWWRHDAVRVLLELDLLLVAALLQVALGISTLLLAVPIPFAAAHQAGAMLLVTATLCLRHACRRPAPVTSVTPIPLRA
jgi:cytochrome c oxidase assembly protein subunit 15